MQSEIPHGMFIDLGMQAGLTSYTVKHDLHKSSNNQILQCCLNMKDYRVQYNVVV